MTAATPTQCPHCNILHADPCDDTRKLECLIYQAQQKLAAMKAEPVITPSTSGAPPISEVPTTSAPVDMEALTAAVHAPEPAPATIPTAPAPSAPVAPPICTAAPTQSDGSTTAYYKLPEGATDILDLIEYKDMSFGVGNIFKACYRLGKKDGVDPVYDLNKIIFFATRARDRAVQAKAFLASTTAK
jgi:hypothetical protein